MSQTNSAAKVCEGDVINDEAGSVNKKIPLSQKISYGFGDFGNGFMFDLGQAYLTKFYTDVAGIGAGAVAGIFGFTKIFDAFMDPIAGTVIDSRKHIGKRGKFRPVMMLSAMLLAVMTVVTFTMPNLSTGGKLVWAYGTYMIWGLVYSFTNDPYGSLASVMSRNPEDRSLMSTTRQVGSVGAQLVTGIAFIPLMMLFPTEKQGYFFAALAMAIIGVCGFAVCYLGTKENVKVNREVQKEKNGFKDYIKVVFTNGPLLALILMTLFTISAMNTNNQMMVYFCQYNLGHIGLQPLVNGIMMGTSVVGVFMIPTLTKHFGKKRTAIAGFIVGAVANILNFIIPTNLWSFIVLVTIGYTGLAIPNGITWAFVSDTIDYGEWHTGVRKEATTYAAFNFSRKIAQSLAAIISAGVLAITGYVANAKQSAQTLMGIKAAMTLYPGVALIAATLILLFLYKLSDGEFKRIANDLDHGRWQHGVIKADK
jgi:glycoside/pentoside/hexuronide:cation symporter, GPH family